MKRKECCILIINRINKLSTKCIQYIYIMNKYILNIINKKYKIIKFILLLKTFYSYSFISRFK